MEGDIQCPVEARNVGEVRQAMHVLPGGDELGEVLSVSAENGVLERRASHEVAGEQAEEFLADKGRDCWKGRTKGGAHAADDVMPMQLQSPQDSATIAGDCADKIRPVVERADPQRLLPPTTNTRRAWQAAEPGIQRFGMLTVEHRR